MGYSAEVMQRARARLAAAKADRESENQQHLYEAYKKVPRLLQIDKQMRETMAEAAKAVFVKGTDGQAVMEQAKRTNLALQQERNALAKQYFEEGYLDESPICSRCGGSGFLGSTMCECLAELCRLEQRKELSLLAAGEHHFAEFDLNYYPQQTDPQYGASPRAIMSRIFSICRDYADNFTANSGNLLFNGNTGLGKTLLSACIAGAVGEKGYSVAYESAHHLFEKLEKDRFHPDEESAQAVAKMNGCDLLILDDLGTELPGSFVNAALYTLMNDRLLAGKPMIISTNLNIDEIRQRYTPQIASRLQGSFQLLPFVGQDIRVLKNK